MNDLDLMTPLELVRLINEQDRLVADAVGRESDRIARAVEAIADRMRNGGRLFYVGAGTSGRIALLDASELPPTYGISADLVQVILAGGPSAFVTAAEGAEDREDDAIAEVAARVGPEDCVIGIAASGTTPFTVAALRRANLTGALTIGVTSIPDSPLSRECDIAIVTEVGPEVVAGSSRMKSGTAQKLVLNTISTAVMIALGKVYGELMVEMPPTNRKLQQRATEMVRTITGATKQSAESALATTQGNIKEAAVMIARGVSRDDAAALLGDHHGNLREALAK